MINRNKKKSGIILFIFSAVLLLTYCTQEKGGSSNGEEGPTVLENKFIKTRLAQDAKPTCVLTETDFSSWFDDGNISKNGLITSANSLDSLNTNCDFYKWSWRMFLWQASPVDGSYVFDSPPFFDLENGNLVVDGSNYATRGGKLESEGQAGLISGVLMSQQAGITPDGSIVFYGIHVNDVYAYFASGKNAGQLENLTEFPITKEDADEIVAYAKETYGVTIEDAESLAMELKSSWIRPAPGLDLSNYITIQADIPKFDKVSDQLWTWDGRSLERNVTLAMVGYHVVGSTLNHPEMVWATFEHVDNSPDVNYYYIDESGNLKERKTFGADGYPVRKDWVFTNGDVKLNASNQMHMQLDSAKIKAMGSFTISPSSTIRTHPWGNTPDTSHALNNTDIISLNENIISMLSPGDIRKNYFLVGATWTANGVPGVGNQLPDVRGSKVLANATMETYFQFNNCFKCHQGGKLSGLSHIIDEVKPLPLPR